MPEPSNPTIAGIPESMQSRLRVFTARAVVKALRNDEPLQAPEQPMQAASWMPMLTEGEPTKLRLDAWLAHAGINRNRQAFREEDLPRAAEAIGAPNLLPMDWNHSAVVEWVEGPKALGVWYAARVEWDAEARDGLGARGVRADGVVWAWAFPEQAAEMLAMQEMRGYIEFSMACIPERVEHTADADGPYEVLVNPVFFTLSALTVPPADPDAVGQIQSKDLTAAQDAIRELAAAAAHSEEERHTMERTHEEQLAALQAQIDTLTQSLTVVQEQFTAATTSVTELQARAEQAELERDALRSELAAATESVTATAAELETARAALAEIEQERAKAAQEARWAERFAALPEAYRTAFARRPEEEQSRFVERWSAADDASWAEFTADLLVGLPDMRVSYRSRSREEGALPSGSHGDSGSTIRSMLKR